MPGTPQRTDDGRKTHSAAGAAAALGHAACSGLSAKRVPSRQRRGALLACNAVWRAARLAFECKACELGGCCWRANAGDAPLARLAVIVF